MRKRLGFLLSATLVSASLLLAPAAVAHHASRDRDIDVTIAAAGYCPINQWCVIEVNAYHGAARFYYEAELRYKGNNVSPQASNRNADCEGNDIGYCKHFLAKYCTTPGCWVWGGGQYDVGGSLGEEYIDVYLRYDGRLRIVVRNTFRGSVIYNGWSIWSWT